METGQVQNNGQRRPAPLGYMWLFIILSWGLFALTLFMSYPFPKSLELVRIVQVSTYVSFAVSFCFSVAVLARKRYGHGILGLLIIAIFPALVILVATGMAKEIKDGFTDFQRQRRLKSAVNESATAENRIVISAVQLTEECIKTGDRYVQNKYREKMLEISGVLERAPGRHQNFGHFLINLKGAKVRSITIAFPAHDQDHMIENLRAGQQVTVCGMLDMINSASIYLKYGYFVKAE